MSEDRFIFASNHKIDRNRIATLVRQAASNADLKFKFKDKESKEEPVDAEVKGKLRSLLLKAIEESVINKIKYWKDGETPISISKDVPIAAKQIIDSSKDTFEDILKKEDLEQWEMDNRIEKHIKDVAIDAIKNYIKAGELPAQKIVASEDLVFASEEEAIQYLSDMTGDKVMIS